ncbi:hypothetical protein [Acidaminobacter sp.]|uniref:hypothetical protein n=1 Tax=Acidaminobacter sp. TaxID=1872102 RepID=UPI00137F8527|nr:hypothetical protein [Acidaminobacter sp.]MDK9710195.1 hypothetical protein [Acidaminobacter sp.]MZQ98719.1 hypothetical protein [Acidaminobacter sp.]
MRRKTIVLLTSIMVLALQFNACELAPNSRSSVEGLDSGWIAAENPEAVKPDSGIASAIISLKGYKAIGWANDQTILAYKYSESVFGEDRGLVFLDSSTLEVSKYFKTVGTYFDGSLSPDRSLLVYVSSSTGRDSAKLNLLDLDSGETKTYERLSLPNDLSWDPYLFKQHFRWTGPNQAWITLNSMSQQLAFAEIDNAQIKYLTLNAAELTQGFPYFYAASFTRMGDKTYGFVHVGEEKQLIKGDLLTQSLEILPVEDPELVWALPDVPALLVVKRPSNQQASQLVIVSEAGEEIKVISNPYLLDFIDLQKNTLLYAARQDGVKTDLGMLNLETGTDSYITSYRDMWIGKLQLSPDGSRLLVDFEYGGPQDQGKPVSHMIVLN